MSVQQIDEQGYMVPAADLECDELTELGWSVPGGDPDFGPAEGWPEWTDEATWELGPAIEPGPFVPDPDDEDWLSRRQLTDEDLEAMARDAAWLDHMEALARFNEQDARAAGLAV